MKKLSTEKVVKKIKTKNLLLKDYDAIFKLQLLCFPDMKPWNKEQYRNIIRIFPDGQIGVEYNKEIIASSCSLMIDSTKYSETSSWSELTDNGYINNHDPHGDTLYGMEIMVHPHFRNMKLARRMYEM